MVLRVLLVYPRNPESFWSFAHVLPFVAKRSAFPPLGLLTVAAMLPPQWEVKLVDTNVEPLEDRDIAWADWVFLSGMIVHRDAARDIARRCAALGRAVIAGGPLFTTGHAGFPEIPHFALGEAEGLIGELVDDMRAGAVKPVYRAAQLPDLRDTPLPRWDLIDMGHYVTMAVQFSRGCPFDCEFCDIVAMYGRVPRTKAPAQLIAELDALQARGWRDMVFIVDDNFIGHKKRVRELLAALGDWRRRTNPAMGFLTEASLNLADQPELLGMMTAAGFKKVFVGLETPVSESLEECRKVQNSRRDLVGSVRAIQQAGLEVMGGFIVGFDSDPADVFDLQYEFIQRAGVVTAMVGLLTALPQTRLYARLVAEGRMLVESAGNNTAAALNFIPRLDQSHLVAGYRDLMRSLYAPDNYYRRVRSFLQAWRPSGPRLRLAGSDVRAFIRSLWALGVRHRGRRAFWRLLIATLLVRPRKLRAAIELAIIGHHFRRVAERL